MSTFEGIAIVTNRWLLASPHELRRLLSSLALWSFWLLILMTIIVIVGVVLELPESRHAYLEWKKGDRKSKRELFSLIGIVLVVLGVSGEAIFEAATGIVDTKIRDIDSKRTDEAEAGSLSALANAREAQRIAATAKTSADGAVRSSNTAVTTAEAMGLRLKVVATELVTDRNELATVEIRRKESEAYIENVAICTAPRVIPSWVDGGKTFVDPLRSFSGFTAKLVVVNDPEAIQAASQLEYALKSAGINVTPGTNPPNENIMPGVLVESYGFANAQHVWPVPSNEASRNAAFALIKFLHAYNWDAKWLDGSSAHTKDLSQMSIRIAVGLYPPPQLVIPPAMREVSSNSAASAARFRIERDKNYADFLDKYFPRKKRAAERAETEKLHRAIMMEDTRTSEQYGDIQPCKRPAPYR